MLNVDSCCYLLTTIVICRQLLTDKVSFVTSTSRQIIVLMRSPDTHRTRIYPKYMHIMQSLCLVIPITKKRRRKDVEKSGCLTSVGSLSFSVETTRLASSRAIYF